MALIEHLHRGEGDGLAALDVPVTRMRFANQAEQVVFLRGMVNAYKGNELMREKAHDIVFRLARCPSRTPACQALAIATWAQKNVTYVNEGEETFQTPVRTLTYRIGDCDEFTTLICTLLEAIGIRSELVALEWQGEFRHIFPRAIVGEMRDGSPVRMPLDATLETPVGRPLRDPIKILRDRGEHVRALVM